MHQVENSVSLPIREDDLWPPGQLVQLFGTRVIGFKGGSVEGASNFVIILTKNELIVKGWRGSTMDIGSDEMTPLVKEGMDFYQDGSDSVLRDYIGEFKCRTSEVSRVLLDKFGAGTKLVAWVHDLNGHELKVIDVLLPVFLPRTIMSLANKAANEGLLNRSRWRGNNSHAWPLFRKEVERRLRQAVPGAEVQVRGRVLDDATFMRLVR